MARYGAQFIIMGGEREVVEGTEHSARSNFTVVEVPSREAATACYNDPEYVETRKLRHSVSEGWQVIVDGYDGPQDYGGRWHCRSQHLNYPGVDHLMSAGLDGQ